MPKRYETVAVGPSDHSSDVEKKERVENLLSIFVPPDPWITSSILFPSPGLNEKRKTGPPPRKPERSKEVKRLFCFLSFHAVSVHSHSAYDSLDGLPSRYPFMSLGKGNSWNRGYVSENERTE